MEDVTDTVFRRLLRRWSLRSGGPGPTVMFTEFTRVDAAIRTWEAHLRHNAWYGRLQHTPEERPLVAQLWGTRPDEFYRAAEAIEALGFDGIDINMGCPARKIRKAGACSALIAVPERAAEIIAACRSGSALPVSVKTRLGLSEVVTGEWIGFLLEQHLDAITVHGRIADEMSEGVADWREVRKAVELRDRIGATSRSGHPTRILGNGDVVSLDHARRLVETTGVDGVMIGRGIFADPLLFARTGTADPPRWETVSLTERLEYIREQIVEFTNHWGTYRNYEVLKKFFRNYVVGVDPGGLLDALYRTTTADEALLIIDEARGSRQGRMIR
ncbi:MAG: tRNA dihydrouridine synthase, partial [Alkalispirochaeta sp.]